MRVARTEREGWLTSGLAHPWLMPDSDLSACLNSGTRAPRAEQDSKIRAIDLAVQVQIAQSVEAPIAKQQADVGSIHNIIAVEV